MNFNFEDKRYVQNFFQQKKVEGIERINGYAIPTWLIKYLRSRHAFNRSNPDATSIPDPDSGLAMAVATFYDEDTELFAAMHSFGNDVDGKLVSWSRGLSAARTFHESLHRLDTSSKTNGNEGFNRLNYAEKRQVIQRWASLNGLTAIASELSAVNLPGGEGVMLPGKFVKWSQALLNDPCVAVMFYATFVKPSTAMMEIVERAKPRWPFQRLVELQNYTIDQLPVDEFRQPIFRSSLPRWGGFSQL